MTMNRNYGYLLFFSAGLFLAGCAGHSGSSDGSAANPPGPGTTPADVDLAAFARTGMTDPEYADPRGVNEVTFATSEQEAEINDVF
jgi:hypothetical protein